MAQASSALSQLSKEDLKARRARIVAAVEAATKGSEIEYDRGQRRDKDSRSYRGKGGSSNYSHRERFADDYEERDSRDRREGHNGRNWREDGERREHFERSDRHGERDHYEHHDRLELHDRHERNEGHWDNNRHDRFAHSERGDGHWHNERSEHREQHDRFEHRDHDSHGGYKGRNGRDGFKGRGSYGERSERDERSESGGERNSRGARGAYGSRFGGGGERFSDSKRPRGPWQGRDSGRDRFSEHRSEHGGERSFACDGERGQGRFTFHERHGAERAVIDVHNVFTSTVPVGQMVPLLVVELNDKGVMVDGAEFGKLFIPRSQVAQELHLGDSLRVFIYQHSGRFLATAKRPYFELGMTGRLKVTSIEHDTVYLDLGIPKELVLPRSEQRRQFAVGDDALVLIAMDELGRLYASQCFNRFIRDTALPEEFVPQQEVKVVAIVHTNLGYRAIVDDRVYGLIYNSEQHGELQIGKRYDGYVTAVRPDGRLDVSLQKAGRDGIEQAAADILQALFYSHGYLHFSDRSSPQEIEDYLHMSKGRFKKAIGSLYKDNMIVITDNGIELTDKGKEYQQQRGLELPVEAEAESDAAADVASDEDGAIGAGAANAVDLGGAAVDYEADDADEALESAEAVASADDSADAADADGADAGAAKADVAEADANKF